MQTINFYLDSYKPKPLSFDSRFALLTIVLSLLGFLIFGWVQASEIEELKLQLAEKNKQSTEQLKQLNAIRDELGTQSIVESLQARLIEGQRELASYNQIITNFNMPQTSKAISFSQIMDDLSRQTVDYLWLTKIKIVSHNLSLNGSTTQPDSIPVYVDKLKQSSSLKRYFDELKIDRGANEDNSLNQIINFELLNGKLLNNGEVN